MSDSPRQVDWQQLLILAEERTPPSNGVRKNRGDRTTGNWFSLLKGVNVCDA